MGGNRRTKILRTEPWSLQSSALEVGGERVGERGEGREERAGEEERRIHHRGRIQSFALDKAM